MVAGEGRKVLKGLLHRHPGLVAVVQKALRERTEGLNRAAQAVKHVWDPVDPVNGREAGARAGGLQEGVGTVLPLPAAQGLGRGVAVAAGAELLLLAGRLVCVPNGNVRHVVGAQEHLHLR